MQKRTVSLEQVDAFTQVSFKGNPAAVIEICDDEFPPSRVLQMMAEENNLSVMHIAVFHGDARGLSFPPQETAFWKRRGTSSEDDVLVADLRWLTPQVEVDICGHATLAAAHSIFGKLPETKKILFHTRSGILEVTRGAGGKLEMIFPVFYPRARPDLQLQQEFEEKLGISPLEEGIGYAFRRRLMLLQVLWEEPLRDAIVVFPSVDSVLEFTPNMTVIASLPSDAFIITAAGSKQGEYDFVYRFFAPKLGVSEDPVTGSAQCSLVPYWSQKLGKTELYSSQVSTRTGELWGKMITGQEVRRGVIQGHMIMPEW